MARNHNRKEEEHQNESSMPTASHSPSTVGMGEQIGPYKLLSILGEGGFGIVYLAEQKTPVKRQVALKIIKPGMDSKQVIARFEAESQALALLGHPNIAHVFRAGSTESGRPYFAMEYIKGMPITEYCDYHKLSIKERLKLFIQVCEAVQHAHQKGIIHRDIKPSNIIVSVQDGKAVPKVIDFGIAKAIGMSLTEKTMFTQQGQLIGTLEYMSPEQADLKEKDIDTRTDIYSLGVVLYELLAGTLPFEPEALREGGYAEIQRIIREQEPPHPSTKLSSLGDEGSKIAKSRHTELSALVKSLHKELEWIPLMAIRKERDQRYKTASDLAEDVQNYLDGNPLVAGPESVVYRLKKSLLRHRVQAIAVVFALVVLILTLFSVNIYLDSKNKQRLAEEEVQKKDIALAEQMVAISLSKAETYFGEGRYGEAMESIEKCVAKKPNRPDIQILHSRILTELGRIEDAIVVLEQLARKHPQEGAVYCFLAVLNLELGNTQQEKIYRDQAQQFPPKTAEAFFLRALTALSLDEALRMLSDGLMLDSHNYRLRKARALIYYNIKDYKNMERDTDRMIFLRQENPLPLPHALYAIALREQGQYAEATKEHDSAIQLTLESDPSDPRVIEFYHQRHETLFRKGDFPAALRDAKKCVSLMPKEYFWRFWVFRSLVALERYDQAKSEYDIITGYGASAKSRFNQWAKKSTFDTLDMGHKLDIPDQLGAHPAFLSLCEAKNLYFTLSTKAKRFIPHALSKSLSPDGKQLAYGRIEQFAKRQRMSEMAERRLFASEGIDIQDNLNSKNVRSLVRNGKDPRWSPNGKYIAFARWPRVYTHRQESVWVVSAHGGEPWRLAKGNVLSWTRDSKHVYYLSDTDYGIYRKQFDDPGAQPVLVVYVRGSYCPAISPNEKYVAYERDGQVHIVDIVSRKTVATWRIPLKEDKGVACLLEWSPDGNEISVSDQKSMGLWIYDLQTNTGHKVLSGPIAHGLWSTDRKRMFFELRHPYLEVWVAELDPDVPTCESLGPGRTKEEHYREFLTRSTNRIKAEPDNIEHYLTRLKYTLYSYEKGKSHDALEILANLPKDPKAAAKVCDQHAWKMIFPAQDKEKSQDALCLTGKSIQLHPRNPLYRRTHGLALYRTDQWKEAIVFLENSSEMFSRHSSHNCISYMFLAMAHEQLGQSGHARKWFGKGLECACKHNQGTDQKIWHSVYEEAAKNLKVQIKSLNREPCMTGKQIVPLAAWVTDNHDDTKVAKPLWDGRGLSDFDHDGLVEHDEDSEFMWCGKKGEAGGSIEFDLGKTYILGSILVWNYNERGKTDRGIRTADLSVWTPDTGWQKIREDYGFTRAEGSFDYDEPVWIKLKGVKANKVRLNDLKNYGDHDLLGLAEVQFFQPWGAKAAKPHPADGEEIALALLAELAWLPGEDVIAHHVYFGTSPNAMKRLGSVPGAYYDKIPELEMNRSYCWRVDAVESDGPIVKGDLWTFSTKEETMVGWWKFDEIEGKIAKDSSGNDSHGKLVGDAKVVLDPFRGKVLSLDGDGDYVKCGSKPMLNIRGPITVTAWIMVSAFDKHCQSIVSKGDAAWRLQRYQQENVLEFACYGLSLPKSSDFANEWGFLDGKTAVDNGRWHHVAGVYDGEKIYLYVDSVLDNSAEAWGEIDTSPHPVFIGENPGAKGREWNGLIDDVRIYNYALNEAQIKSLYLGTVGSRASIPTPLDGEDIWSPPGPIKLSWGPAKDAVAYKVYFGTDSNDLSLLDTVKDTTSVQSPELRQLQRYSWRVDSVRSDGSVETGDLWTFSTKEMVADLINAQVTPISYTGFVEENFDSIGATGTAAPPGWTIGPSTPTFNRVDAPTNGFTNRAMIVDTGTNVTEANRGNVFNTGTPGDSDRSIACIPTTSGFGDAGIQVALVNNTGGPLTKINLLYTGEQWYCSQCTSLNPEILKVYISTTANFQAGTFERLPAKFEFEAPQNTHPFRRLDGHAAENRVEEIGGEYTLITPIAAGATFYITWHDWNNTAYDHPLSLDDVEIGLTP